MKNSLKHTKELSKYLKQEYNAKAINFANGSSTLRLTWCDSTGKPSPIVFVAYTPSSQGAVKDMKKDIDKAVKTMSTDDD